LSGYTMWQGSSIAKSHLTSGNSLSNIEGSETHFILDEAVQCCSSEV
jgi:hypothetical protein